MFFVWSTCGVQNEWIYESIVASQTLRFPGQPWPIGKWSLAFREHNLQCILPKPNRFSDLLHPMLCTNTHWSSHCQSTVALQTLVTYAKSILGNISHEKLDSMHTFTSTTRVPTSQLFYSHHLHPPVHFPSQFQFMALLSLMRKTSLTAMLFTTQFRILLPHKATCMILNLEHLQWRATFTICDRRQTLIQRFALESCRHPPLRHTKLPHVDSKLHYTFTRWWYTHLRFWYLFLRQRETTLAKPAPRECPVIMSL